MVTSYQNQDELTALLRDAIAGNQARYAEFLHAITPLLRRMVLRYVPAADSEDIVQEILISIHKARHTYDGNRPIKPWLIAIARFRITDYLRRYYATGRNRTVDIDAFTETLADDVTESLETHESIEKILADVPDRERQILTLMHVEGYTAKQVGEQLQMKESAVKVAAHRAIKRLRGKWVAHG